MMTTTKRIDASDAIVAPWKAALNELPGGPNIAHVEEYFDVWAADEMKFRAFVDNVNLIDFHAHIRQQQAKDADGSPKSQFGNDLRILSGGIVVISIDGPMQKHHSSFSGGTSTIETRRDVRHAMVNDEILGVVLRIDSAGGTVSGTHDLAMDVRALASKKPVYVFIEDICASAAYWVASQGTKVFANAPAIIGSIGTFLVITDTSKANEEAGIKVEVIRAGEFKGAGVEGTELTVEQRAEFQRTVNDLNAHFLKGVSVGRKMSMTQVKAIADGRVFVGKEAIENGMIDEVKSFDDTMLAIRRETAGSRQSNPKSKGVTMSGDKATAEPTAASFVELTKRFPTASAEFIVQCQKEELTMEDAVTVRMAALEKQAADAKAEAKAAKEVPSNPPTGTRIEADGASDTEIGDAQEQIDAKAATLMGRGLSKAEAYKEVLLANPDLRAASVMQHNRKHGRRHAVVNV